MAQRADAVIFFQWRQTRKGAEKFQSAMVPENGDKNSRVFREVEKLGNELKIWITTELSSTAIFQWTSSDR
jgi:beta-galactosidase